MSRRRVYYRCLQLISFYYYTAGRPLTLDFDDRCRRCSSMSRQHGFTLMSDTLIATAGLPGP